MTRKTTLESLDKLHSTNGTEKTDAILRKILWSIETGKTVMEQVDAEYSLDEFDELLEWYGEYKTPKGNLWGITVRMEHKAARKLSRSVLMVETTKRCETYTGQFAAKAVSMMLRNERMKEREKTSAELDEDE